MGYFAAVVFMALASQCSISAAFNLEGRQKLLQPCGLQLDRRNFLLLPAALLPVRPLKTQARGLVQFPVDDPSDLLNMYHVLRVGTTLLEQEDIWSTNPLFLYVLHPRLRYDSYLLILPLFLPEPTEKLH